MCIVNVNEMRPYRITPDIYQVRSMCFKTRLSGCLPQRSVSPCEQCALVACLSERLHQQEYLALPAPHISSRVHVENMQLILHPGRQLQLSAWTHVPGLRVLHKIVEARHVGDAKPLHAIEESELQNIRAEKCPGRIKKKPGES